MTVKKGNQCPLEILFYHAFLISLSQRSIGTLSALSAMRMDVPSLPGPEWQRNCARAELHTRLNPLL